MKNRLLFLTIMSLVVLAPGRVLAYDHSEVAPSGQILYYTIAPSGATVVYPGANVLNTWAGYEKPAGSLVIPDSVQYDGVKYQVVAVDAYAFSRCEGITSVVLPVGLRTLKSGAFAHCSSLSSITLPEGLKYIGWQAFAYDSSLTQITFPQGLDSIEYGAFEQTRLTHISIPASVTYMARSIVPYCPTIESITVENGNPVYDSRNDCNAIIETGTNTLVAGCKNSTIPNDVAKIGFSAFSGCAGLSSMAIPESVTEIESYAFSDCPTLVSVSLPGKLKK